MGNPLQVTGSESEKTYRLMEQMFALEKGWTDLPAEERKAKRNEMLKPVLTSYWEHLNSFEAEKETTLYKAQQYSIKQRKYFDVVP